MVKENPTAEDVFFKFQKYYYRILDTIWRSVPSKCGFFLATFIVCFSGLWLHGNWAFVLLCLCKQLGIGSVQPEDGIHLAEFPSFESPLLKGFASNAAISVLFGYVVYFPMCGFIHWYFYIRRRDRPDEWKCQPRKFLSWKDEKHEIVLGSVIITLTSLLSGVVNTYLENGGYSTLYYGFSDYGWTYLILSIPLLFLYTDLSLYYAHRMMHLPFFYRNFHKMHHRYKQPTPFSATAMHPFEMFVYQICTFLPIFVVPVHWSLVVANALYMFYYSIVDHSGVKMDAMWPWQPSTIFHDNHHQFFHVNFGFNSSLWDKLHGTYRQKDKIYNERIFFGYGKNAEEATREELREYMQEEN